MGERRGLGPGLAGLVTRPTLLVEALRAALAMRRRGGLSPSPRYLAWRYQTAYGDSAVPPRPDDLAAYLAWRRTMRRLA